MPDEPRPGDAGWHSASSTPGQQSVDRPTRRRRRSMEDSGGVSVSDLVAKHGNSRQDLTPVPPPPHVAAQQHAAAPQPEAPTGRRHAQQPPAPQPNLSQPSRPMPVADGPRRGAGGQPRANNQPRAAQPRTNGDPGQRAGQPRTGQPRAGRSAAPPRAMPPQYRMQGQGTPRTRSGNEIAPGQPDQPQSPGQSPSQASAELPVQIDPARQLDPRQADPRQSQRPGQRMAPPAPGQAPGPQHPNPQNPNTQSARQNPTAQNPTAQNLSAPSQSGQHPAVGANRAGRQQPSGPNPIGRPPGPGGPVNGAGVAVPTRPQRGGRPPAAGRPRPQGPIPVPPPALPGDDGIASRLGGLEQGGLEQGGVEQGGVAPEATPSKAAQSKPNLPLAGAGPAQSSGPHPVNGLPKAGPERREDIDPTCLTSEMEPISELVEQKRTVDATLARFSAVHDEMVAEERERRSRRMKIMPWLGKDQDMEEALAPTSMTSASLPVNGGARPRADEDDLDEVEPAVPETRWQSKRNRKRGRTILSAKIAACAAAVLILVITFFGWRAKADVTNTQIQEVAALDENSPAIVNSQKQYGDQNFLLVGAANRPGSTASGDNSTDMITLLHFPGDDSRAVFVSFPPNLEVNRPACQVWDNQASSNTSQALPAAQAVKLDSIYAAGGPKCLTDTIQQLTGLRFNHFVGVDFGGFRDLVNGVGGVDLCTKAPLKDSTLGTIVDRSGPVSMSGDQALNFVRAGQVGGDQQPADLSRINRQQRFLAAFLRKTVGQQNLLMDQNLLNTFLGTFARSTFGDNMGVDQLAKLAVGLQSLSLGRVTFVTVPTANTLNAAGNETLASDPAKQLFTAIIDNSPLPNETAGQGGGASTPQSPVTPQGTKVQVLNGIPNATQALAGQTTTKLRNFGFTVNNVSNTQQTVSQTVIKYSANQAAQAKLLASSVPIATLQVDPSQDGAIQLILGPGFDSNVVAPNPNSAAGGAAATSEAPTNGVSYLNATDASCA